MNSQFKFIIGLFVLNVFYTTPIMGVGEKAILEFLEELRIRMCHPIPKFGLPALDPMRISQKDLEMDNQYLIDFTGSITNFSLNGLSDFIINDLRINTVPLRRSIIDISMPFTALSTLYTAKGSLAYILNIDGHDRAEAAVSKVRVAISWAFKTGLHLGIRNLKIEITIGDLHVDFGHLLEEDRINDFLNALINELGLELLDDIWKYENEFVVTVLEEKINQFIGKYTLSDIIKIIGGGGDEPIFGPNDPPGDCKNVKKYRYDVENYELTHSSAEFVPIVN